MQLLPVLDSTGTLQSITAIVGDYQLTLTFPKVLDVTHVDGTRLMGLFSTADYFYDTSDTKANHASNTFRFAEITTVPEQLPDTELDALIEDVFASLNQGHLVNAFLYEKLSSYKTDSSTVIGFIDERGFEPLLQHVRCADDTIGWVVNCRDLAVTEPEFRGLQDQLVSVLGLHSHVSYFVSINDQSVNFDYYDRRIMTGSPNTLHSLCVSVLEFDNQLRNYYAPAAPVTEETSATESDDEDSVGEYTEIADADYREMLMHQEPSYVDPDDIEDGVFEEGISDSPVH